MIATVMIILKEITMKKMMIIIIAKKELSQAQFLMKMMKIHHQKQGAIEI